MIQHDPFVTRTIGIDFDNTIACYAGVFREVGIELGMLPASVSDSKSAVRTYLRQAGQEEQWICLQSEVYGNRMHLASVFTGFKECLTRCLEAGYQVYIVSHKTERSNRAPFYDLRAAARTFLLQHGIAGEGCLLPLQQVFFEPDRIAKIERIKLLGCGVFIDDLPELFDEPSFPRSTRSILFDPNESNTSQQERIVSWNELGVCRIKDFCCDKRSLDCKNSK